MDIVSATFALLMLISIACAVGALFYGLEAGWEDLLAVAHAQHETMLEDCSDAWRARSASARIPHAFCAVVDVGALWEMAGADAPVRAEGAGSRGLSAAARYRAYAGTPHATAYRMAELSAHIRATVSYAKATAGERAPVVESGVAGLSAQTGRTLVPAGLSVSLRAPKLPMSLSARSLRSEATYGAAHIAGNSADGAETGRTSGVYAARGESMPGADTGAERVDAWGRRVRPRRLSAADWQALRSGAPAPMRAAS